MSKSYGNTIDLFGDDAEVKKRIMGIKTDSTPVEAPKPRGRRRSTSCSRSCSAGASSRASTRPGEQGGKGYGDFKKRLLAAYHATFDAGARPLPGAAAGPGARWTRILRAGAERARAVAAPVIARVREAVGIER